MPIPQEEINTKWIQVAEDETVGAVLARLPGDRTQRAFFYIVLPVAGGRYIVARWVEVEQIAAQTDT